MSVTGIGRPQVFCERCGRVWAVGAAVCITGSGRMGFTIRAFQGEYGANVSEFLGEDW